MRTFTDISSALGLKKFLSSSLGTLYFVPASMRASRVIVRHFDSELPITLVEAFADLIHSTQRWIERYPELDRLVRIEQPIEVGRDFIARRHLVYTSTSAYVDDEDPPELPEELEPMRSAFRAATGQSADPRDAIIETVLARSLLEPTGKTFFDESEGRFIVVEPKPTREELERWATLAA